MVIVIKPGTSDEAILKIRKEMETQGFTIHESRGANFCVLGVVGDTAAFDVRNLMVKDCVEKVLRVQEPYKRANRLFHPADSVIDVSGVKIGGNKVQVIAGPCSVESEDQITAVAEAVKKSGASLMRGGAFKPRTSPYSFQGLREEGLDLLQVAKKKTGLPIVTEIMSARMIERYVEDVDLIQVGARNMQNFELLKELGRTRKPILLKRGLSATIEEWLMSAEYIMSEGNHNVILCERGIRTFEKATRNTLDLSAIAAVKRMSHLPIIVDPSHATGKRWMVESMAMAAIAAGADGIMCEVHNDPENAWCDGAESITPETFDHMMKKLREIAPIVGREL